LVFLTGQPGVGKSTVVSKVVEALREKCVKVGGMMTRELRESGSRVGFEIEDLDSGRRGILAHVNQRHGPSVGKYRVKLDDLIGIGVAAIEKAVEKADVIVIDEVGPMETSSEEFKRIVAKAVESGRTLLGTLHIRSKESFMRNLGLHSSVEIIEVTTSNRTELPEKIVNAITSQL